MPLAVADRQYPRFQVHPYQKEPLLVVRVLPSGMTRAYGSENASAADSKLTPCFLTLMAALRSSHSNSMYPFSIILT